MQTEFKPVSRFRPSAIRLRVRRCFVEVLAALVVLTSVAALSPVRAAEVAPGVMEGAMEKVLVVRSADTADRLLGSALLWGESAEVAVTAAHVVGKAGEVRLVDQAGRSMVGVVIARDEVRDVALVALGEGFAGRPGFVPAAAMAGLGQAVWALGAPLGLDFTLTRGQVSATARQVDVAVPIRMVQHDAAVNPGSSGGPLVDAEGRLLGMNTRIADGSRMFVGIAYAISADDLARIVPLLIAEDLLAFPKMEFRMRPIDRMIAAALGVSEGGLLIEDVSVGGMADRAGLKAGDVVLAVDGAVIEQPGAFAFLIEAAQARGEADLAILRAGRAVLVTIVFAEPRETGLLERNLPGSEAARRASYRIESLGLELGEAGRIDKLLDNSPALWAGLVAGDRILSVNGVALDTPALRALELTEPAVVLVQGRNGRTRHVILDPWNTAAGLRPVGDANVLDPTVSVF